MFKKVSKFLLVLTIAVAVLGTTVMADTLIDAGNSPMDYELHVAIQITGSGSVNESPGPNSDAAYPDSVALEAVADSGWYFDHWEVGGVMHVPGTEPGDYTVSPAAGSYSGSTLTVTVSGTDNNGTDENPDGYVTVTAVFLEEQKEVMLYTYTGWGNGTTSPGSAGQGYLPGQTATASATPDSGWEFLFWASWVEGGDGGEVFASTPVSYDNPYNFTIESDTYLYAIFGEVQGNNVTTTQNIPGAGSTSHPAGVLVPSGDSVTISASAAAGYDFSHWNLIGTSGGAYYSNADTLTITPTGDMVFEAIFVEEDIPPQEVVVSSAPNDPAWGSTSPVSTTVPVGTNVVLSAAPAAPVVTTVGTTTTTLTYSFVEWQDGTGAVVSTSPSFTYNAVTSAGFIAIFEELESIEEEDIPEDIPEEILDEEIPEDVPMPQTSGIPMEVASLFGGSLVALGTVIKRKRTK